MIRKKLMMSPIDQTVIIRIRQIINYLSKVHPKFHRFRFYSQSFPLKRLNKWSLIRLSWLAGRSRYRGQKCSFIEIFPSEFNFGPESTVELSSRSKPAGNWNFGKTSWFPNLSRARSRCREFTFQFSKQTFPTSCVSKL